MVRFDYTKQNHVEFGYNSGRYNLRQKPTDRIWLKYGQIQRSPGSFEEECLRSAHEIHEHFSGPFNICYSGGMDSEVTLLSFYKAGIPVRAATVRFFHGKNEHDIAPTYRFCRERGIPHDVYDLDLESFWQSEVFDYAQRTFCPSPQFPVTMWLMDQVDGVPVVGSGDCAVMRKENTNEFFFKEEEKYFSLYQHLFVSARPGVPAFLQYTPEQMYAFFTHPRLQEYIQGRAKREKLISISKYKHRIYSDSFSEVEGRPVYNGFEKLSKVESEIRRRLRREYGSGEHSFRFALKNIIACLEGKAAVQYELVPPPEEV